MTDAPCQPSRDPSRRSRGLLKKDWGSFTLGESATAPPKKCLEAQGPSADASAAAGFFSSRQGLLSLKAESFGVDAVPAASRTGGWFSLFVMYAGINVCLPMMMMGGILVPGLSFKEAVVVGLIGNTVAAAIISLTGYPGADHGLPASVLTRSSLGFPSGTWIASLAITVSGIGWFAFQAELAGLAADGVMERMSGFSSPVLMISVMGALNVVIAVMGFGWIQRLATWSVPALLVLCSLLFWKIALDHPFQELINRPGDGSLSFLAGMNIMVSGQFTAAFTSSDLSRYSKDHRSLWLGIWSGIVPVSAFMIGLGALSRLVSGEWNPVLGVQQLGLGIPALVLIIFATWTTNDKNLYSGGLALTNIFPGRSRWLHTLVLGFFGTALGCFGVTRYLAEFLVALGAIFAPLVGVMIADYFLVRGRRPAMEDFYSRDGRYRYTRGVNLAALVALAAGVVAGRLAPPESIQPIVSLVVTMVVYGGGMRLLYPLQFRVEAST